VNFIEIIIKINIYIGVNLRNNAIVPGPASVRNHGCGIVVFRRCKGFCEIADGGGFGEKVKKKITLLGN
jgi:hypothetical protein